MFVQIALPGGTHMAEGLALKLWTVHVEWSLMDLKGTSKLNLEQMNNNNSIHSIQFNSIHSIQFILYFNVLTQQLQEPITESAQV
jgi:hypothetical protein